MSSHLGVVCGLSEQQGTPVRGPDLLGHERVPPHEVQHIIRQSVGGVDAPGSQLVRYTLARESEGWRKNEKKRRSEQVQETGREGRGEEDSCLVATGGGLREGRRDGLRGWRDAFGLEEGTIPLPCIKRNSVLVC